MLASLAQGVQRSLSCILPTCLGNTSPRMSAAPGKTHEVRKQRQPALHRIIDCIIAGNCNKVYITGICKDVVVSSLLASSLPSCTPMGPGERGTAFVQWRDPSQGNRLRGGAWVFAPHDVKDPDGCILFIHGGSFWNFHPLTGAYDVFCSRVAKRSGMVVVCPDHLKSHLGRPYTAKKIIAQLLQDLEWLSVMDPVSRGPRTSPPRLFLMGDSSGACQALSLLLLAARESQKLLPLVKAVLLVCPWFDLSCRSPGYISNAYGPIGHTGDVCWPRPAHLHPIMSRECALEYLGSETLLRDPVFSPYWLCRDQGRDLVETLALHSIALWLLTGASEVLAAEVLDFTQRLGRRLLVETWLHEGMFHDFMGYETPVAPFHSQIASWDEMEKFFELVRADANSIRRGVNYFIEPWN
mmetsp:Transcript_6041/g.19393  ORF Transcript_6041/g.19393 Transcript_6041/m.19393 type:complete len:411 (+) Transcript_6041:73-1305(+)